MKVQRRTLILFAVSILSMMLLAVCSLVLPYPSRAAPFVSPFASPRHVYMPVIASDYRVSKKCVGLSWGFDLQKMLALGTRCTYEYNSTMTGCTPQVDCPAMVQWPTPLHVVGYSRYFLGWNEPDNAGITPQMAAEIWPRVIAANPGYLAVSPAPSHLHPEWMGEFYAAHLARWGYPPKMNVLAVHCYGSADYCIALVSQVVGYAEKWNISQVWVTEFAFTDAWSAFYPEGATWKSEATKFIDWMNAQPLITRYYWWAMMYNSTDPAQWWSFGWSTQLYDWGTGQLNERGLFYQAVK